MYLADKPNNLNYQYLDKKIPEDKVNTKKMSYLRCLDYIFQMDKACSMMHHLPSKNPHHIDCKLRKSCCPHQSYIDLHCKPNMMTMNYPLQEDCNDQLGMIYRQVIANYP